eukprot:TRINITY_DN3234_c0_g1_i1.p1 TRINITY_DN3234_c0_g1~~TRINITY_DN3234_c0_g1_i1.p1  ORF type:complete len:223 (+),score=81.99 TRINITY_DN3234_c0_g1_i1:168-836(+)
MEGDLAVELQKHQEDMQEWADNVTSTANEMKMAHKKNMQTQKENVSTLQKTLASKNQSAEDTKRDIAAETANLERTREKLNDLQTKENALPEKVDAARQSLARDRQAVETLKSEAATAEKERKYKIHELSKGISLYKKHLGLEFQRVGNDRLRFIFWNIDPAKHDRKFYFNIRINPSQVYQLVSCKPPLEDADDLVQKLNSTNDFSQFVQAMRRKFCALVQR